MDSYPLPYFTYHEALLLTLSPIVMGLPEIRYPPSASVDEEVKRFTSRAEGFARQVRHKVTEFLSGLADEDLSEFWDFNIDEFRRKLEDLNEMQNFRLYFALKKYFWECDKYHTQAEALCEAGFFPKDSLPFAQRVETLDNRRRLSHAIAARKKKA